MELGNRFYARLAASMRPRASLRLTELMKKYQYVDDKGAPIPDSYNGIEMFLKLREEMSDKVSDADALTYARQYEKLRDNPPPDNVKPQAWATRLNNYQVHINPYLTHPLAGKDLADFILGQLPKGLGPP